jgi:hypothetical protein
MKPLSITPCECGHAEIVTGHQRACIASRKGLQLAIRPAGNKLKSNCPICEGQIMFDKNSGTNRFVRLKVCAHDNITHPK